MNEASVKVYASQADKLERDPYGPDGSGRATVVNGRGFARWQRFHRSDSIVWIDLDGRMVGLTPWQAKVYDLARAKVDRGGVKIRDMAHELGCAASTVSRALVKLMAWGLIGYIAGRGRNGGVVIFRMVKGDGFDRFRQAARAKVRAWAKASNERVSRLWGFVAPYILEEGRSRDTYFDALLSTTTYKVATIRPWTVAELREAGIL